MDRHNTKRPRESSSSSFSSSSSADATTYEQSSPPEIANVKRQHLHDDGQESPPGTTLFDFDLSFGVFDFPWLKDGLIYSKSEDWKFEDVFFTSFFNRALSTAVDATPPLTIETTFTELSEKLLWCNLPDPWEEDYEAQAPPSLDGGEQAGERMDCIWRSLLNQPLQQGNSAL